MAVSEVAIRLEEPQKVITEPIRALAELLEILDQPENKETSPLSSSSQLKCPKVPESLRSDVHYYEPKVMSLGPYHHGKPNLVRGETLKLKLAAAYIQETARWSEEDYSARQVVDLIYKKISSSIKELRGCYDGQGSTKEYSDEEFSVMMLVDGCALLAYILCICLGGDPEDFNIRHEDLSLIHQDALLLENQLPYQLLENLMDENMLADTDFRADVFQ